MPKHDAPIRGSLSKFAPMMRDPDPVTQREYARTIWQRHGAALITSDMLASMSWADREMITAIAVRHYGKRPA
jgi:hypothetical protein